MTRRKGTKPEQYAGAFQHSSEIPPRYRLETYAGQYRGEDTYDEYVQEVLYPEHDSDRLRSSVKRARFSWFQHMDKVGRHHALARPEDAGDWCRKLLAADRTPETCYEYYYNRIYQFYTHLKCHNDHPHLYNPLLLAAIEYDAAREIWMCRINNRPEVVDRE